MRTVFDVETYRVYSGLVCLSLVMLKDKAPVGPVILGVSFYGG